MDTADLPILFDIIQAKLDKGQTVWIYSANGDLGLVNSITQDAAPGWRPMISIKYHIADGHKALVHAWSFELPEFEALRMAKHKRNRWSEGWLIDNRGMM
jgi:hypothetical protein